MVHSQFIIVQRQQSRPQFVSDEETNKSALRRFLLVMAYGHQGWKWADNVRK
jgi:hypothetical protein